MIRTILEERKVLSKIRHPFICNLNFAFQDEAFYCLVLDFVDSGDLRHHLERYTFSEMTIKHWIAELACAVDYLHEHNIVHRDIKPENILMSSEGHVCLADFNIARELTCRRPVINGVSGTFNYLAPEIHRGQPYTEQVDWWALGVVFYECIYKRVPFRVRHRSEILAVMDAGLVFPETDPPVAVSCKQGICALLNMEPFLRVTNAEELFAVEFFDGYDRGVLEAIPYIMRTSELSSDISSSSSPLCSNTSESLNPTAVASTASIRVPPIYDVAYHPFFKQDMEELKHYSACQAAKDEMRGEYQKWYSKQIQVKIERQRRQKEQNMRKERAKQKLERDMEKIERRHMLENVPQVGIKRAVNVNKLFEENKKNPAVNVKVAEVDNFPKKHKNVDEELRKEYKKEDKKEKKKKKKQNKTGLSTKLSKLGAGRVLVVSLAMMKKNAELKRNSRRHEKEAARITEQVGEPGECTMTRNEQEKIDNFDFHKSRVPVPRQGPRDVTPICNQPIKNYQQNHRQYLTSGYNGSINSEESNGTGESGCGPSINVPKCPHEEGMEPRAPQVLKHKLDIQRSFEPFDYRDSRECRCSTVYCGLGVAAKRLEERSLEVLQQWEELNNAGEGFENFSESESESEVSSSSKCSGSDTTAVNDGLESQTGFDLKVAAAMRKSRSAMEAAILVKELKPINKMHTKNSHSCGEIVTAAIERLAAQSGVQLTVGRAVSATSTMTANMTVTSGTSCPGSISGRRRVPGGQQQQHHQHHQHQRHSRAIALPTKSTGANIMLNGCRVQRAGRVPSGSLRSSYEESTGLPLGVLGTGQQGRVVI